MSELKNWYNSPDCPVEKEEVSFIQKVVSCYFISLIFQVSTDENRPNIIRLHDARGHSYFNSDAEVVGVYTYPEDQTEDVILCLWDGEPSRDQKTSYPFYNHLDLDHPPVVERMTVDPQLACITGHTLYPPEDDWSVCVFVFDEHAPSARKLKPGDLIRVYNLQCTLKHNVS